MQSNDKSKRIQQRVLVCYIVCFPLYVIIGMIHSWQIENDSLRFFINDSGDVTNFFGIWVGAVIGAIISWLFFHIQSIQEDTKREITKTREETEKALKFTEVIYQAYVVRTVLFNLKDNFTGDKFREKEIIPSESEKIKFLNLLDEYYFKQFNNIKESVKTVNDLAKNHPKLHPTHIPENCDYCKEHGLIEKIKTALDDVKHPLLG